jgi:acyl-coenzyme A synthetase/AMP-(fatty) acid ligase
VSAIVEKGDVAQRVSAWLPLLINNDLDRAFAHRDGRVISAREFLADVQSVVMQLPSASHAVNLCEDRYHFIVAFCAVVLAGQTNLLPSSRAPQAIADVMHAHPNSYALADSVRDAVPPRLFVLPKLTGRAAGGERVPSIGAEHRVAIGFTSGSTGQPKPNPKGWRTVCASSARNAALLGALDRNVNVIATVPPQHMYGLELSVLLPLCSRAAIEVSQPFFPADIAQALQRVAAPRILVTTPFHLRALVQSDVVLPDLEAVVCATAPLDAQLARDVEQRFATRVVEVFGSTETCVIAHRRTSLAEAWRLYDGVHLRPQPDGTLVEADYFIAPALLQDIVELDGERRFVLRGRNGDLLDIAGKRASLGDLNHRLLAIDGVRDGVMFTLDADAKGVQRLAALVVAEGLSETDIVDRLRRAIDPVFLPRVVRIVAALPRNATGKLPREALLAALRA